MFMAMGMGLNPILMFALYWRPRIDRKCQGTNRQDKTDTNIGRKRRVTEALMSAHYGHYAGRGPFRPIRRQTLLSLLVGSDAA